MLTHLSIRDFAIAEHIELELHSGMTTVTGETGAGKSIMLDALGLCMGNRAEAGMVREGSAQADISASFDIDTIAAARTWLQDRDFDSAGECIIRRVITAEGRSRAYINGRTTTAQDLRELSRHLLEIHAQHAHQALLQKNHQRNLLDAFGGLQNQVSKLGAIAGEWSTLRQQLKQIEDVQQSGTAQQQLLRYQLEELDNLALEDDEISALEAEQKQLGNVDTCLRDSQQALALCTDDQGAIDLLRTALALVEPLAPEYRQLTNVQQSLENACIQAEEAIADLHRAVGSIEANPSRLLDVENRLDAIYNVARKHKLQPYQLPGHHRELQEQLAAIENSEVMVRELENNIARCEAEYRQVAEKLSERRKQQAKKLSKRVNQQLDRLAMPGCRMSIAVSNNDSPTLSPNGTDKVEVMISTAPGQTPKPLAKIASGGELTRISLAIQVVTATVSEIPTMLFDEVDVGIGGAVAEVVGLLLSELGQSRQILCVTHQAQVASKADHHLHVSKTRERKSQHTSLTLLDEQGKIDEIARMIGGISISDQSLAHAREMLKRCH